MQFGMGKLTSALFTSLVLTVGATNVQAVTIIDTEFVSNGSNVNIEGTTVGITTNLPGGNWLVGGGFTWANPRVPATWMGEDFKNSINMADQQTAVALSLGSAGAYVKPTQFSVSAELAMIENRNHLIGLGFWSPMVPRYAPTSTAGFTGLMLNEQNDTLQVYANGVATGAAVSTGTDASESTPALNVFYSLSYDVDTTTGSISNVKFAGNSVVGLSTTAFTDAATQFVGALSAADSRAFMKNLAVESIESAAVPEPASIGLAGAMLGGLLLRRKR